MESCSTVELLSLLLFISVRSPRLVLPCQYPMCQGFREDSVLPFLLLKKGRKEFVSLQAKEFLLKLCKCKKCEHIKVGHEYE